MMHEKTRRDFLRLSATGLVAAATTDALPSVGSSAPDGEILRWVTNPGLRFQRAASLQWKPSSRPRAKDDIVVDPGKRGQEILGFGAAFTDASCYTLNQLSASARDHLIHELFHPSEMGFSVCRTCIGSSDYSTKVYSYDEGDPDPDLTRFSIDHDREYILPVLRQAREVNPDLFLFSSPWSPPGWMKSSGSMLGGAIWQRYLPNYARYFLKFLQAYEAAGIPIQAITPQNEVDTDQDGRMPACIWPQEYEIGFVKRELGPLLQANGIATRIWILDHNYNLWGRAICELDDPELRKFCNAVAWHGYVGKPAMMGKVAAAHPEVEMHWTEGGPDFTSPDYLTDWGKWAHTFSEILRNGCRSVTAWNIALDEQGRPNIGPFSCGGLVTVHSQTKEITRSGQYWAFAHFSRLIRRGARRLDSQGGADGVEHVAFENPGGQRVIVITNPGPAQSATLHLGKSHTEITLEGDSVNSLAWS